MKIRKSKKRISEIQEILLEYFKDGELDILDDDTRLEIESYSIHDYSTKCYKGVTLNYLCKYLLNNKYKKRLVAFAIMNLVYKGKLRTFLCHDIDQIIFTTFGDWGKVFKKRSEFYSYPHFEFDLYIKEKVIPYKRKTYLKSNN